MLTNADAVRSRMLAVRDLARQADTAVLARATFELLVVKGPVLAQEYDEPSTRHYGDIDIIVRREMVVEAIAELENEGATLLDANWEAAARERWGQVHLAMPHGTLVDLHWHLVNAGRVRGTVRVDMDDAWTDPRPVTVPGGTVLTLSVTNTVVHVAMHAALGGAWQPRWFADVRAVVASEPVDWDAVIARARQWRVARLVGVALHRAVTFGGADIPSAATSALLRGPLSPRAVSWLDKAWPPTAAGHDWSPARLWPHLVRDDWRSTARAVGWRIERRLRNGPTGFWHGRALPHEMVPTGGDAARERFLQAVHDGRWR